jgi:hypothetical protein
MRPSRGPAPGHGRGTGGAGRRVHHRAGGPVASVTGERLRALLPRATRPLRPGEGSPTCCRVAETTDPDGRQTVGHNRTRRRQRRVKYWRRLGAAGRWGYRFRVRARVTKGRLRYRRPFRICLVVPGPRIELGTLRFSVRRWPSFRVPGCPVLSSCESGAAFTIPRFPASSQPVPAVLSSVLSSTAPGETRCRARSTTPLGVVEPGLERPILPDIMPYGHRVRHPAAAHTGRSSCPRQYRSGNRRARPSMLYLGC